MLSRDSHRKYRLIYRDRFSLLQRLADDYVCEAFFCGQGELFLTIN